MEQTVLDIEPGDFTKPSEALSGSSIGQHLRHSLELFMCLEKGYHSGIVNYDDRPRDKRIETDKIAAVQAIRQIRKFLQLNRTDRLMRLEISPDLGNSQPIAIETTLFRELAYNIDHIVHHLAIIKIGLKEVAPYICLPEHFGVAASTIRHQKEQHAVGSR
ncbi:MAG TPA: hypothetical protein VG737_09510 [Cyclobacteriaceae bacterium]|nr:hypothetical protein [Cyclobacteriaceae bacterium]